MTTLDKIKAEIEQMETLVTKFEVLDILDKYAGQEPCDDVVSRQAVLDLLHNKFADGFDSDRWWNSMSVLYAINNAPSVRPQEQIGHWIFDEILDRHYYCSECMSMGVDYWDYCPNCGAKMVEPQESEKINCKSTKCENCQNHNYCDYEPQERSDKE